MLRCSIEQVRRRQGLSTALADFQALPCGRFTGPRMRVSKPRSPGIGGPAQRKGVLRQRVLAGRGQLALALGVHQCSGALHLPEPLRPVLTQPLKVDSGWRRQAGAGRVGAVEPHAAAGGSRGRLVGC